ncbi:PD-(D/E)XK nuclease family protein [Ligilactobacillus equi]
MTQAKCKAKCLNTLNQHQNTDQYLKKFLKAYQNLSQKQIQ